MKVELTEDELNEIIRVLDYADDHIPSQKLYELSEKLKGEKICEQTGTDKGFT